MEEEEEEYTFDIGEWVKPYGLESDQYAGVITECWKEKGFTFYEVFSEKKGTQTFFERDLYLA
jgi:hypothetical protein